MNDKVFYPYQNKEFPVAVKGKGIYIWDETGKKYVDASSGPVASIIGHGVKEIREAVITQIKELEFAHRFVFSNNPLKNLAEMVAEAAPAGIEKTLFLAGGSEAVEASIKIARAYFVEIGKPEKYKIISRRMSYHGNTIGALSLSGLPDRRRKYTPLLMDIPHVSPVNCYHCPFGKNPVGCGLDCAKEFETAILHEGAENVAAIIIEPISGAGMGAVVPHEEYLPLLREICDRYEVLMIADEIMTAMGRTGKTWAMDHWNVIPDLITMAKGISGGYAPVGAVSVKTHIYDAFKNGQGDFSHGHTYGSHPVCMAAGIAVMKYIKDNDLINNSAVMGKYLQNKLNQLEAIYPQIGQVRGRGLMMGIEFVEDTSSRTPYDPRLGLTARIIQMARDEGLLLYGSPKCIDGTKGDAVMIAPPLTVSTEEIDLIIEMFDHVLAKVFASI